MPSLLLPPLSSPKRSSGSSSKSLQAFSHDEEEDHMVDRLAKIEYENPICADCPTRCPRWVSFLRDRIDDDKKKEKEGDDQSLKPALKVEGFLCVVVCDDCAIQHHKVLSKERCMIKCLECVHEWTNKEVDIVLGSGNQLTNRLYEADLFVDKSFIASNYEGMQPSFIKQKYKRHKFRDDKLLENFLLLVHKRGIQKAKKRFLQQDDKRKTWAANARRKTCAGHEIRRTNSTPEACSPVQETAAEELRRGGRSSLGLRRSRISNRQGSHGRGSMPTLLEEHAVSDSTTNTTSQRNEVWESRGTRTTSPSSVTSGAGMGMLVPNNSSYRSSNRSSSRVLSNAIGKMKNSLSISGSSSEKTIGNHRSGVPVSIHASEETKSVSSLGSYGSSSGRGSVFGGEDYSSNHAPAVAPQEVRIASTTPGSSQATRGRRRRHYSSSGNGNWRTTLVKCASTSTLDLDKKSSNAKSVCTMDSPHELVSRSSRGVHGADYEEDRYDDICSIDDSGSRRSSTSSSGRRSVTWGEKSILSMCSDEPAMSCRPSLHRTQSLPVCGRPKAGILRNSYA